MKKWHRGLWLAAPLPLFAVLGVAAMLPFTNAGSAWLLRQIPGVQVEAPQGALLGAFAARRVDLQFGANHIRLDGVRWSEPSVGWKSLAFDQLSADEVALELAPSKTKAEAPTDLLLPLELNVSHLTVTRLRQGNLLLQDIAGRVSLGAEEHNADLTHLRWEKLELSGKARIATHGDMALHAQAQARDANWNGEAQLDGPLNTLNVKAWLEQSHQRLQLAGQVKPFAAWPLNALQARAEDLDLQALSASLPKTKLSGEAQIESKGWDQVAQLSAQFTNAAAGRWDQQALPVQSLSLRAQARPDQVQSLQGLQVDHFEARLGSAKQPAGAIIGQGKLEAGQRWRVQAKLIDIRPERIDARAAPMLLAGNAELAGAPDEPFALTAHLSGKQATLDLAAKLAGEKVTVSRAELVSGSAHATIKGEAERAGNGWHLSADAALSDLDPHAFWNGVASTKLSGQGKADLRTTGTDQWPQGDASFEFKGLLGGTLRYTNGDFQAHVAVQSNTLDTSGRLAGKPSDPQLTLETRLKAPRLYEFNALLDLLGIKQRLAGSAEGHFQASPSGVEGQLALADVQMAGQTLKKAQLDISGTLQNHRTKLDAIGLLNRPGQPPSQAFAGEVHAQLEGGWQPKTRQWTGRHMNFSARPTDARLPAMLSLEDGALTLDFSAATELLAAKAEPGSIDLGGARWRWSRLEWQAPRTANALPEIHAALTLDTLAVGPLLARWQPDFGWGGDLRVGGHVRLDTGDKVDVEVLIERQGGDLTVTDEQKRSRALGINAALLSLTAQNGVWRFTPQLSGTGWGELSGNVTVRSNALVPAGDAPLSGQLKVQVAELGGWGALLPAGWRLGGRLEAAVDLGGTLGAAHMAGSARGSGLSARHMLMGVNLDKGQFELAFDGDSARLQQLSFNGGDGHVEASGEARLGELPRALVTLKAEHFTVFQRVDRSLVLSGQAQLNLTPQELQLEGQMRADSGLFDFTRAGAPTLGDDVQILRPAAERNAAGPATPGATTPPAEPRKIYVRLAMDLGDQLKLRGRGLETRLAGQLELTQQAGPPRLKGTVRAVGGTYAAYGQKLEVERGEVIFNGAYDNPRLDILAVRPDLDTRVGVLVTGTALAPRIQLYSEPDMSDGDKLSWLLLGRGPEELGRADTALLQRAALALLAGEGEGDTSKLIKRLGLDDISVRQSELTGSEGEARETIVHIGRQLSRNWYVAYERSLNATTGSWQLIYRIARRFTLRMQTGEDNAVDLIWQWRW